MMTAMPQCAVYIRVSTKGQEDGTSLLTQEQLCRAYADEHGYDVAAIYREVFTGTELWDRPELTRLRQAVRAKQVQAVVVQNTDRLARDPVHKLVILSEADHAGVPVLFVTEPSDNSPEGQLISFVRGYAAKVEHLKIVERTKRGLAARVASGRPNASNRPPYGYRWEDPERHAKTKLVIYEPEAVIVRRIFREVLDGSTLRQIAAGLMAEGIPNRSGAGGRWLVGAIAGVIRNPVYVGRYCAGRFGRAGDTGRKQLLPADAWQVLPEVAPALTDEAAWTAAAERLAANKQDATRNNANPEGFLLRAGFAVCGQCGRALSCRNKYVPKRGVTMRFYECLHGRDYPGSCKQFYVSARRIDDAVWKQVIDVLTDPRLLDAETERLTTVEAQAGDLDSLERALAQVRKKGLNLDRALAEAPEIVRKRVLTQMAENAAEEQALVRECDSVLNRQRDREAVRTQVHLVREQVRSLLEAPDLDYETKRLALRGLGVRVRVWPRGTDPQAVLELTLPDSDEPVMFTLCMWRSAR